VIRESEITNPYLIARREWDERYGSLITRARNWRFVAFLCAAAALVQSAGLVALSMRSKVVPYIVAVDSLGRQIAAVSAEQATPTDDRLKRAALFDWISDLRTVTNDPVAQRKAIDRVYARVANGSQAMTLISEYYRNDPPHKRAQSETVSIDVQAVLPTSDRTYQVEWIENTRDVQGQVKSEERWKGAFTIVLNPPTDELLAHVNPLGIYVTTVSWTRVF
jgi:type IV secretion system protein VirB5